MTLYFGRLIAIGFIDLNPFSKHQKDDQEIRQLFCIAY